MSRWPLIIVLLCLVQTSYADDVDARIDWSERVTMSTLVSGVVNQIGVSVGQQVKKGDLLLRLDQDLFKARLAQAAKTLESAVLNMQEGEKEWERAQELYERTVLSDHELATAKTAYAKSVSEHEIAKADLARAKYELNYSELRAPFDGVVVSVDVAQGQTVIQQNQNTPMITIANNQSLIVQTAISLSKANKINKNTRIQVKVEGKLYTAKLHSLAVEPQDDKYLLRVIFNAKGKSFRKGEKAEIVLP
jgi:RND family efflux transporter MFP subunit